MEQMQVEEPENQLLQLLKQLEAVPKDQLPQTLLTYFKPCNKSLENFAIYFLAALRQQTEQHFRTSGSNESETPKCLTPVRKATNRPTPAELALNESQLSNLSIGSASTPVRQSNNPPQQHQGRRSGQHSQQFSSTPQSSERSQGNRSGGGAGGGSFCLGDFMLNATPHQRAKKKVTPQATGTTAAATSQDKSQKPRRRVLPMTISKNVSSCSSFGDSSFSNENNLLRLSQSCELDRSQGAALEQEARKTLLLHKQEIKSEAPVATSQQFEPPEREPEMPPSVAIDLDQVTQPQQLQLLAAIYGQLMDLNLVPNVLSELGYAMQLLNIRGTSDEVASPEEISPLALLSRYKECIYFAVQLLEQQQQLLLQLDRKSLTVLLQHERVSLLSQQLQQQLESSCQRKQQQSKAIPQDSQQQQNVYYQHDKDSRDNFPTQNEFCAFKRQRDLFYEALKHWETTHLNRMFSFSLELGSSVREIFKQSEHAVNMSHFAKLFVSQLLMSSGETHESPAELGLKLDQQRLNRLAQRLVTSNSSVEDQFPRTQAFFRDFISNCGSIAFLVQLQLALYVQLLRHNDSSFELLPLQPDDDEAEQEQAAPYVVRPQAMAELLMLAKFLGYVYALPYNRATSNYACPQQLQLRRQFQPPFEMRVHLERAMQQGKLLITLPWLVQYLMMLDLVSLQLPASLATLELLYALYSEARANPQQPLQSCALFITRSCLGWLLESQPTLSSGYYNQRTSGKRSEATAALVKDCLRSLCFAQDQGKVAAMLEELLPVACPFLHDFRVAITPSQRQAQRSGRYRYITTRLEQLSSSNNSSGVKSQPQLQSEQQGNESSSQELQSPQRKLNEAFLHSQNASMRRLLEFVTERSFKCVVKDAQQQILQPAKSAADALVNGISSTQEAEVLRELQRIYQQAWTQACQQWTQQVPGMLDKRIEQSLKALLPENTNEVLRSTYAHLIRQQAQAQLQQWLQTSVRQTTFYQLDLQEVASKVCRSNKNSSQSTATTGATSNEMSLNTAAVELRLSQLLQELQQWIHCLSLRPEHLRHMCELPELMQRTRQAAQLPQLPTYFYELLGSIVVRLLQLLICRQPLLCTPTLISASCDVWLSPQLIATATVPGDAPECLEALLSVQFMQELSLHLPGFQLLQQLLHAMLDAGVLHMEQLNQLFMPLFKENWTPPVWNALSQLLQQVSQNRGEGDTSRVDDDGKSHLFMEVLADLSRDLDSF
ncbi:protein disks lost [Drosophila sulfurigaster albostrigata]|uniref:protein disks lost n=1 Tax=Drosophila sulfurigaster albostrigata TaxID=89887 RepID=UPI002D2187D2|nr:protein disks lost [Drosophila sulfurigaster albostrigata]